MGGEIRRKARGEQIFEEREIGGADCESEGDEHTEKTLSECLHGGGYIATACRDHDLSRRRGRLSRLAEQGAQHFHFPRLKR